MLILSGEDLRSALPMEEAISAMETAFRLSGEQFQAPLRSHLSLAEPEASFLIMPAASALLGTAGAKIVSVIPRNTERGLAPIQAYYALVSAEDGRLLALMDGKYLTAVRTAATSALATRLLSRDVSARLALFGTGTQAFHHLEALALVRDLAEVRICGSSLAKSESFAKRIAALYPFPIRSANPEEAVRGAEIVCTCTTSPSPLFNGSLLGEGVHVNAIGAFQPHTREIDDETIRRARIVVDNRAGAMTEAGDILIPLSTGVLRKEQIAGELAQVVTGEVEGRSSEDEITLFKSVGFALEDLAAGLRAWENARKLAVGLETPL